jgi:hypothetical protein
VGGKNFFCDCHGMNRRHYNLTSVCFLNSILFRALM